MSSCGRGSTCTLTTSPTRPAAAAPASTAAFTAATSPTTNAVTRPLPIFCQPTSVTLADLSMASLASINAVRPFVSIMPRASRVPLAIAVHSNLERCCWLLEQFHLGRMYQVHRVALVGVDVDLKLRRRRQPHQKILQHRRT